MKPTDVLNAMISKRGLTYIQASLQAGRSRGYMGRMVYKKVVPGTAVLADIGDRLGFDLILRDRQDGSTIIIDPPEDE